MTVSLFVPQASRSPKDQPVALVPLDGFPEHLAGPRPARTFVQSIVRHGVASPVLLAERPDGDVHFRGRHYRLVDGNRRVMGARLAGCESVPALVAPIASDGEIEQLRLTLNAARADNPVTEYTAIAALLRAGHSTSDIARLTGYPPAKIGARLRLQSLHRELFAALAAQRISTGVAEAAAKLPFSMQERVVTILETNGKVGREDVRDVRQAQTGAARAELPDTLFDGTDADADVGDWREDARDALTRLGARLELAQVGDATAGPVLRATRSVLNLLGTSQVQPPPAAAAAVDAA